MLPCSHRHRGRPAAHRNHRDAADPESEADRQDPKQRDTPPQKSTVCDQYQEGKDWSDEGGRWGVAALGDLGFIFFLFINAFSYHRK